MSAHGDDPNPIDLVRDASREGAWWRYWRDEDGLERAGVGIAERIVGARGSGVALPPEQIPWSERLGFLSIGFRAPRRSRPWRQTARTELVIPSTVVERRRRVERGATTRRPVTPATFEESTYRERVTAALRAIDGGVVDKVVVACAAELGRGDPVSTLELLSQAAVGCRVFGTSNGDWTFVGATPEPLMTLEGDVVKTCALAGTSGLGDDGLAASEKDLREHRWVVDSIRRSLSPHCARLDIPASPGIKRLSTIQHLHTPISGRIRDGIHPRELVAALHPTPAVCGSPREPAAKLVDELEPFDRGLYAGVLGWVGGGWADLGVAIRSALFLHDRTILYAGAGIVAGSDPRREAAEVREKLRSIAQWVRLV